MVHFLPLPSGSPLLFLAACWEPMASSADDESGGPEQRLAGVGGLATSGGSVEPSRGLASAGAASTGVRAGERPLPGDSSRMWRNTS